MHKFSLSVARIEMLRQDAEHSVAGAIGTAFFYGSAQRPFLITNWHNVTGVNPETGETLHSKGLIPNVLRLHYKRWVDDAKSAVQSQAIDLQLYEDGKPTWFEHSGRGSVDEIALS